MMREFVLIEHIKKRIKDINGDDAAVLLIAPDKKLLASSDALVSGVHFLPDAKPYDIGWKAIAVNVSDIAAMGGIPKYCLVSLILPKKTTEKFVDSLYDGMIAACSEYKTTIVGGNITSGDTLVVSITCLGEGEFERLLYRSGAKPGELVLVTGSLGDASVANWEKVPNARLHEALVIAQSKLATAMIDLSDGLSSDVQHLCDASDVGVTIWADKLPRAVYATIEQALNGGEDYELCFTVAKENAQTISHVVKEKTGTKVTVIGEILAAKDGRNLVLENTKTVPLTPKGWEH